VIYKSNQPPRPEAPVYDPKEDAQLTCITNGRQPAICEESGP